MAYLLSQYPAVNHAFMLREIRLLRRLGFEIHVTSIRKPDRDPSLMTRVEQEEVQATYYVAGESAIQAVLCNLRTFVSRPGSYIRGLLCALRGGGWHPRRMLYHLLYFAEAVLAGDWMIRNRLRHVHTHYASTVGWMMTRTFPVTLSITFHGPAEFEDPAGFLVPDKVRAALFVCAISQYGLSQLMYICGYPQWPKLELTPLGVNLEEFPPRPFRLDPSPFRMICPGRLAPVKGQRVLVAAMEKLVREGRNIRLHFAGDGPERAELQREVESGGISGHVCFEGNLNQDRLRALYRESDALVLSSFAEGLPVVLMEAMAMEIPCVATWVAGVPELIRDEVDGLLVPAGDADALAAAITRLESDPALRRRLGQQARQRASEKVDLQKNVEWLAQVFRRRLGADVTTGRATLVSS